MEVRQMKKSIEELYREAKRFDEGTFYQRKDYEETITRQMELYMIMRNRFAPSFITLMEELLKTVYAEMELECLHFFEQGYLAGAAGKGE